MSKFCAVVFVDCLLLLFSMTGVLARVEEDERRGTHGDAFVSNLNEQIHASIPKKEKPEDEDPSATNAEASAEGSAIAAEEFDATTFDEDIDFERVATRRSIPKHKTANASPSLSPSPTTPSPASPSPAPIESTVPLFDRPKRSRHTEPRIEVVRIQSVNEMIEEDTGSDSTSETATRHRSGGHAAVVTVLTIGTVLFASVTALYAYRLWERIQLRRYRGWRPYEFELTDL